MRYEEVVPPPPHRLDQGHIEKVETDRGGCELRVKGFQLPLDYYLSHNHITKRQYRAGRRYATLHTMSKHLHHHVQFRYEESGGRGGEFEARFLISVQFVEATKAVRGVMEGFIARKVCLDEDKAGRANMHYLRSALDQLADHFAEQGRNQQR